jgi:hypothetical protein
MSEQTQEQVGNPFAGMKFSKRQNQPIAEEPVAQVEEEQPEEVAEATQPEAEESKEVKETPASEEQGNDLPAKEETEESPEQEDGVVTVDFGQEEQQTDQEVPTETVDAYKTRIQTLEEEIAKLKETPKLDPRIAKLNEIVQNGGDINQSVWEMQSKDYSEVDMKSTDGALTILKDKLKYIDGDDNDLVSYYIEDNFPVLAGAKGEDDFDTDEEFQSAKRKEEMMLRKEAKQSIAPLKEFQEKMRLPSAPQHNQQEEYQKAVEQYRSEAITKVDEINTFDIALDDTTLRIPITGEAKKFARAVATDPENQGQFFLNRYVKEDGSTNFNRLYTEMYYLENRPLIEKALYSQGKSAGKKEAIQELQGENASIPQKTGSGRSRGETKKNPFQNMVFSKRTTR